jgi:predicted transglutaminase-like cysteine proteinase
MCRERGHGLSGSRRLGHCAGLYTFYALDRVRLMRTRRVETRKLMFYEYSMGDVAKSLFIVLLVVAQNPAIAEPAAIAHSQSAGIGAEASSTALSTQPQSNDEPFGLSVATAPDDESITLQRNVQAGMSLDHEALVRCQANEDCPPAALQFLEIVAEGHKVEGRAQIGVINRAINFAIRPDKGKAATSASSNWNSPLGSLAAGHGDCKNYAVAKYLALLEVGISSADIRLVIVRDRLVDQDHAVVAVRLNQHWIVLDNRWLALAEDTELLRFEPLAVLELDGVVQHPAALVSILSPPYRSPFHLPNVTD